MDDIEARRNTSVTTTLGCIVGGDEGRQGPIYFCARIFTSWWASEQIIKALQQQLENNKPPISVEIEFKVDVFGKDRSKDQTKTEKVQTTELTELRGIGSKESHAAGPKEAGPEAPEKDINVEAATRTQGKIEDSPREEDSGITAEVLDSSLNIEPAKITAYPEWGQINAIQWITFVLGYIFGLLVVWCTCGPALFVLYTTPPVVSCFTLPL